MTTVVAIIAGLMPILWSTGASFEAMQRIAAPKMVKGYGLACSPADQPRPQSRNADALRVY